LRVFLPGRRYKESSPSWYLSEDEDDEGARSLLCLLLRERIISVLKEPDPNDEEEIEFHKESVEWFKSDSRGMVDFRGVCDQLDFDYRSLRAKIFSLSGKGKSEMIKSLRELKI